MIYDMIEERTKPRPNDYLVSRIKMVWERPVMVIKRAFEEAQRTPRPRPVSTGTRVVSATETIAHFERMAELKETAFAPEHEPDDLSFMAAIEQITANRLQLLSQSEQPAASNEEVVFG